MQETQTFSVEKIELTPNPRSVKFILNQAVLDEGSKTLEEGGYFSKEIVTEIKPLEKFYYAEEYHQDYEKNNPYNPYVQQVSIPRLRKFQKQYPELIKADH